MFGPVHRPVTARWRESEGYPLPRADLHQAFAIDRDVYEASRVDRAVLDPVVRIDGALPAVARPFVVVREYQGPQGLYVEYFELRTADDELLVRSSPIRIDLSGEAFEDRFITPLRHVGISTLAEHRLTFFVDDHEVGGVPVFIEPVGGGSARTAAQATLASALKKSTILWVTVPEHGNGRRRRVPEQTRPVWFVADDDKVYLLHGPGEQHLPGLGTTPTVRLHARSKDTQSLVSDIECDTVVVPTDDERWDRIAQKAVLRRLNLADGGDDTIRRWREHCTMVELTPRFGPEEPQGVPTSETPVPAAAGGGSSTPQATATPDRSDEIHVEAQVDQEVMDRLLSEGMPERVARAKAKAHYVRSERDRIRAERAGA